MPNPGTFRFVFGGMNLTDAPDAIAEGKYAWAQNVRRTAQNNVRGRPGAQQIFNCDPGRVTDLAGFATLGTDDKPRFLARLADGSLWLDTGTQIASGISGEGATMLPFRPAESPQVWMYVASTGGYIKVSSPDATGTVTVQKVGIAEPQWDSQVVGPQAVPQVQHYTQFTAESANWVTGGSASEFIETGTRSQGDIGFSAPDPAGPGPNGFQRRWSTSIVPDINNFGIGELLTVTTTPDLTVIQIVDIIPPLPDTYVKEIFYYTSGQGVYAGRCVIELPQMPVGSGTPETMSSPRRGMLVQLQHQDAPATSETVCVLNVINGPSGSIAIEVETHQTFQKGDFVVGFFTLVFDSQRDLGTDIGPYWPLAAFPEGDPFVATYPFCSINQGVGTLTQTFGSNPFGKFQTPGIDTWPQLNDYIHVSLYVDDPTKLIEIKLVFSLDGSWDDNILFYSIEPGSLVGGVANLETQTQVILEAQTQSVIDAFGIAGLYSPGQTQGKWSEFMIPLSSFTRNGTDTGLSLLSASAVQFQINTTGTVNFGWNSLYVCGGGQPDVGDNGSDYRYRAKPRSTKTGVSGNPTPEMTYGVRPRRQNVVVMPPATPSDPQVDVWDWYRYGGTVTSYRYIGTSSVGEQFIDQYSDDAARAGQELVSDDTEPWPSIDAPWEVTTGAGTVLNVRGQYLFVTGAASYPGSIASWLPGTLFVVGQEAHTLRSRPVAIAGGWQFEFNESSQNTLPDKVYVLEPNVAAVPHPFMCGPDAYGTIASWGDGYRPGTVSFAKQYFPDSAPTAYTLELSPPSEPIVGGEVMNGLIYVWSTRRWWALYPAFNTPQRYNPIEQQVGRVGVSPFGHDTDGQAIYFWAKDGIAMTGGSGSKNLTLSDLQSLFPYGDTQGQPLTRYGVTVNPPDYKQVAKFRIAVAWPILYANYIDTGGVWQTLVCDLRDEGWSWDFYNGFQASAHFGVKQQAAPLTGGPAALYPFVILGDLTGNVYTFMEGVGDTGGPVQAKIATREWDANDPTPNGLWGDPYMDAMAPSGLTVSVTNLNAKGTQTAISASLLRALSKVDNGTGTLQRFLGLYVEWEEFSLQPVATELFQYQFLTVPNFVSGWRTQFLSHGLKGYQSIYRMEGSYSSTTPVEITITAFDGTSPAIITLPSTGGAYQKILLTPTFNKGQLFRYAFSSASPFQLVLSDWIVWIALWGREDTARVFRLVRSESEGAVRI